MARGERGNGKGREGRKGERGIEKNVLGLGWKGNI